MVRVSDQGRLRDKTERNNLLDLFLNMGKAAVWEAFRIV